MAKKLGDVVIAIVILVFLITGFSMFINEADSVTNTDSGYVTTSLVSLNSTLSSGTNNLTSDFIQKTDNSSGAYTQADDTEGVKGGREAAGILNILSKNILTNFFNLLATQLKIPAIILWLLVSLVGITISIYILRAVLTEGRI